MALNKKRVIAPLALLCLLLSFCYAFNYIPFTKKAKAADTHIHCTPEHHVCVMKTMFGLETASAIPVISAEELPAEVQTSIEKGNSWIATAQQPDGGWGSGSHTRQDVNDPHAVPSDPATTSVVCLSLLRTGNTLTTGVYHDAMARATGFLLKAIESWPQNQPRLTTLQGTQPQVKLGENIDAILTVQYLSQLLKYGQTDSWKQRIESAVNKCVRRIEKEQDTDGGWKGGGWAPVLQSSLADQALEGAKDVGIAVDSTVLERSKSYQNGNFDTATKSAVTGKAAGVMLYAFSSTTRSSAKEARKAKDILSKAKKAGRVREEEGLNEITLSRAGLAPAEAKKLTTAYLINENTRQQATRSDVMEGFGSNGGEEIISYLMTGESILMQGNASEWKKWYDAMSKQMIGIQQPDGHWQGHHCITSPVFCTAAALLVLSINNDWNSTAKAQF